MADTYPIVLGTITIASREDDGAQYTVTLPDGTVRTVGDAQDEYWAIARVLDGEHDPDTTTPTTQEV